MTPKKSKIYFFCFIFISAYLCLQPPPTLSTSNGDDPFTLYMKAYNLMQMVRKEIPNSQDKELIKEQAEQLLFELKHIYPDWDPNAVTVLIKQCKELKIEPPAAEDLPRKPLAKQEMPGMLNTIKRSSKKYATVKYLKKEIVTLELKNDSLAESVRTLKGQLELTKRDSSKLEKEITELKKKLEKSKNQTKDQTAFKQSGESF